MVIVDLNPVTNAALTGVTQRPVQLTSRADTDPLSKVSLIQKEEMFAIVCMTIKLLNDRLLPKSFQSRMEIKASSRLTVSEKSKAHENDYDVHMLGALRHKSAL